MANQTSCSIKEAPDGLYDIEHMLGQGGQCSVWLATYKGNGALVAAVQRHALHMILMRDKDLVRSIACCAESGL